MPIVDMQFEEGIFFARELGRIEKEDAEAWADAARHYAELSPSPIVALVDALEVTHVTAMARQVFALASGIPGLKVASVATSDASVTQTAQIIGLMARNHHTYVFPTLEQARIFAEAQAEAARSGGR